MYHLQPRQRKLLFAGVIAVSTICAQYTTLLMAHEDTGEEVQEVERQIANWNDAETVGLVQYLYEHRSEGSGNGNFKAQTLNNAAKSIATLRSMGPVKSGKMVRTKWTSVCYLTPLQCIFVLIRDPSAKTYL